MRLYHRRSSASKDRLSVPNGIYFSNTLRLQNLSANGYKDSLGINRPRSQSLFPTAEHSVVIPPRSRSASFSGASKGPEFGGLTASEEEHIFQCYTRVMYIILGGLAAVAVGLVLYGLVKFQWKKLAYKLCDIYQSYTKL